MDFASRPVGSAQIVGDYYFATNSARLAPGLFDRLANAVLIKPNQAGTMTHAERTVQIARSSCFATVLSVLSGDTQCSWLADLAVGWSAGQIRAGLAMRSGRTAMGNRFLEIEAAAGNAARFAGGVHSRHRRTNALPTGGFPSSTGHAQPADLGPDRQIHTHGRRSPVGPEERRDCSQSNSVTHHLGFRAECAPSTPRPCRIVACQPRRVDDGDPSAEEVVLDVLLERLA